MDATARWTIEQTLAAMQLEDLQVSSRGAIAFVASPCAASGQQPLPRQIWRAGSGAAATCVSDPAQRDWCPRWSPDGATLAFVSDRSGAAQIMLDDGDGAIPCGTLPGEPGALCWLPSGKRLAFLLADQAAAPQHDPAVLEHQPQRSQIWSIDRHDGTLACHSPADWHVWEFAPAPDGGFVAIASAEPFEWAWFGAVPVWFADGQPPTVLEAWAGRQYGCPRVAPDGHAVAWLSAIWSDRGANGGAVVLLDRRSGARRVLPTGDDASIWWLGWSADGRQLHLLGYRATAASYASLDVAADVLCEHYRGTEAWEESHASQYLLPAGGFAVLRSSPTHPCEAWCWQPASGWRQISAIQPSHAGMRLAATHAVSWQSDDGMTIDGWLVVPPDAPEPRRLPLVTWVHGGPAWLHRAGFTGAGREAAQLLAAQGYAVLLPNPRGSTNRGVAFTEAAIGDFGGGDWCDVRSGIDALVARGVADPARLAIAGWSYGGYLAAWAISQTDHFAAAIVGAGITNWRSFHGTASIGAWDRLGLRGDPYAAGAIYDDRSPVLHAARITTPTLIIHGAEDTIVQVGQALELYRALRDHQVPVCAVIYPREPHGFGERAHIADRHRRQLEWLARWLGTPPA